MSLIKRSLPHILIVLGFIIASLAFFNPVLSGKMLYQNDIKLYEGMAKQQKDHRTKTGNETFWNNAAYGGMPTYQMGAKFPHDYMDKLDRLIRFLPRPADYLFLYLVSFYILMLVMRVPWKMAVLGALAFGFSAYLIIIIGVGHNSKAHAIAYFPLVIAGILLVFQKRYVWGFILTALAMGLEIQANHYQMTYYLGLLVFVLGVSYFIDAVKKKEIPHFFKSVSLLVIAVILGLATNATTLLSTSEYAETSIRGKDLLAENNITGASGKSGLDYDYITEYSYGKLESLNLFVPKLMGLGRASDLGNDSAFYQKLIELGQPVEQARYYSNVTGLYWGDQPFVEAPPYLGITVVFLALLGLLLTKGRLRWWLIGGMILSLALSWGKNLDFLTRFFVDYVPMYNKFRAVSSIQVILELLVPIAAVFGLHRLFNDRIPFAERQKKFFISLGVFGGLTLIFWLFGGSLFSFKTASETQLAIEQPFIFDAIKEDRITLLKSDSLRSLIYIILLGGVLWFMLKKKISENLTLLIVGVLIIADLVTIDRRSVDEGSFISKRKYQSYFQPTKVDNEILKDKSYYRVLDQARGLNNSHTNYFFNSLNGYSAVRPRKMEDLYFKHIAKGNLQVLNMLNVKYIIQRGEKGGLEYQENPGINGAAWFVEELKYVDGYKSEFDALGSIDTKKTAVIRKDFKSELGDFQPIKDSVSTASISKTTPDHLAYNVYTTNPGFLVLSEVYYKNGWKAYIDDKPEPIYPVDYTLRGIKVPAGNHKVEFKFEPQVVKTGSSITLISSILLMILILGGVFYQYKKTGSLLPLTKEDK
ncbi:YfhO family protein [Aquimarina sp. 2201CG5-10]|uniref:YfhO family protein n=1 Tax=Aquimarina callyspongiae TaxID=3098150 RepID=UPI002AB3DB8A|nr:YfhO family protein [Aquimarina sp. 2201CG5-10]MDY8135538.1 YfhO family protein [Aquimarina sp. 2201CG5-10]